MNINENVLCIGVVDGVESCVFALPMQEKHSPLRQ